MENTLSKELYVYTHPKREWYEVRLKSNHFTFATAPSKEVLLDRLKVLVTKYEDVEGLYRAFNNLNYYRPLKKEEKARKDVQYDKIDATFKKEIEAYIEGLEVRKPKLTLAPKPKVKVEVKKKVTPQVTPQAKPLKVDPTPQAKVEVEAPKKKLGIKRLIIKK